jgi:6-pyruvoyltetrahydropterin/6-carboxytetrahydropterin synthase
MSYRICKRFEFAASYQLEGLTPGHQCGRLHGHNYVVEVELESMNPDSLGFVVDFGELGEFKRWLDAEFDHRHLNDHELFRGMNTTAENLARVMFDKAAGMWHEVIAVRVSETPKTWAEYRI